MAGRNEAIASGKSGNCNGVNVGYSNGLPPAPPSRQLKGCAAQNLPPLAGNTSDGQFNHFYSQSIASSALSNRKQEQQQQQQYFCNNNPTATCKQRQAHSLAYANEQQPVEGIAPARQQQQQQQQHPTSAYVACSATASQQRGWRQAEAHIRLQQQPQQVQGRSAHAGGSSQFGRQQRSSQKQQQQQYECEHEYSQQMSHNTNNNNNVIQQSSRHQKGHSTSGSSMPLNCSLLKTDFHGQDEREFARQSQDQYQQDPEREYDDDDINLEYANQLRRSQMQQRISANNYAHSSSTSTSNSNSTATHENVKLRNNNQSKSYNDSQQAQMKATVASSQPTRETRAKVINKSDNGNNTQSQSPRESLHVNFNRSSQKGAFGCDAEPDGEGGRKKKYLTAKYGQQQMNLIKKRLKIEMWLHEQLQELANKSKTKVNPDELDSVDIDLDQLLDMDDDCTRRQWLRKTLEPLGELPSDSMEKFICDVLEQSKLL